MSVIPLKPGIIYGPVKSRRLGPSLGLNILPTRYKLCSCNCVYCQYGWTEKYADDSSGSPSDFATEAEFENALEHALRAEQKINAITFSGNGEPTLHPHFEPLVDIALRLKQRYFPDAKLGVLSNSSTAHDPAVSRALSKLDFRIMKLDAGSPQTFRKINRPGKSTEYSLIVKSLKTLENVTLQTMFIDGTISNTIEQEVNEWIEKLSEIQPLKAQVYTLHRPPAEPSLRMVPPQRIREIATQAEKATGITVEAIIAKSPYNGKTVDSGEHVT